ncbi:MaoC family dehydratase N-terminal domain-containing protein [Afifella sp. IM 167]|uniref:FAS1-like dehydratase domain-containing protein n=1 Tax=Afifella sp. IM 167 TaxID=2033586 RepID=UPI001CC94ED3|nr:MaoC family dehydratase N-terminal domain-containing protein [Afifella sp. IM 167]MBZ8134788.1 hypothetical protein [Afifella sp. IM 167]
MTAAETGRSLASYLGELKPLMGAGAPEVEATHPVEASEVRRFIQASMDDPARYCDEDGTLRFAPPAFPMHMFRRGLDEADPLEAMTDAGFDGLRRSFRPGLPAIDFPFSRLLNGGYAYSFFRLVRIGERVRRASSYRDIYHREGRSGGSLFLLIADAYATADGEPLLETVETVIMR